MITLRGEYSTALVLVDFVGGINYFYPTTLMLESKDSIIVSGHANGYKCVMVRLQGIKALMDKIINED